jgi:DNA-binding HxlR family transcriptional regulator
MPLPALHRLLDCTTVLPLCELDDDHDMPVLPMKSLLGVPGAGRVVKLLSEKWAIPLFALLQGGTKRHAQLRRGMPGVSQRMLTKTLRSLERRGLVTRRVHQQTPPMVEYSLTPLARSLNRAMEPVCRWIERFGTELERHEKTST